ncbi:MAG: S10 family peptidase [Ginsengibacter sp.]
MKKAFVLLFMIAAFASVNAQKNDSKQSSAEHRNPMVIVDSFVITKHTVTIKGQTVPYTAKTGTLPVWDENGKPIASVFYTYYERSDVKDRASRPLVISFNGGPGTPSLWMEIGYTGPRILNVDDEGYPVEPYGLHDNPNSILEVADIVYVDPVNTGYSRKVSEDVESSKFFGVNEDIKYLAQWINTFVTRNDRWASPKFLIGESYGTTRVSGLARELQDAEWMYLDGVVLVSPTDLGIKRDGPVGEALMLPYYSATAWYHKMLPPDLQSKNLTDLLPQVEKFTVNDLIPALTKGSMLTDQEKENIAETMSRYSGLNQKVIMEHNLIIPANFYWKELLRDSGYTIGRLDSRYRGIDKQAAGLGPDYNAELTAWTHAFTPAMNIYLRDELNYKTDLKYNVFGNVYPWDHKNDNTGNDLRMAMAENPFLHLMVQSGYFDGACDFFNAQYSLWQMDPAGRLKDRITWHGLQTGHMVYMRKDDRATANEQLRQFILSSIPKKGESAKY